MTSLAGIDTNLSSLSLFVATPEQVLESRRRTFVEWGMGMSTKEYLDRDARTDEDECGRNGKFTTWVLAPRDEPQTLDFASSIETYCRTGLVWKQSSRGDTSLRPSVIPEKVICYGLASLFTLPQYRGRGYGRHLMRLLHWVIADEPRAKFPVEWGLPPPRVQSVGNGRFSALWSDVGAHYYDQCGPTFEDRGWVSRGSFSTTWNVYRDIPPPIKDESNDWVWLDEEHVIELWDRDADYIARALKPSQNHQVSFTFLPDQGVAAFQHRRMKVFTDKLTPAIQHWGIIAKSTWEADPDTFATWTFEVRPSGPKTLLITRLRCKPEKFEGLFREVLATASKHGMEQVEVYNLPSELQSTAVSLGGTTFEREVHVPAFKWYGEENPNEVAWLLNERFCWC